MSFKSDFEIWEETIKNIKQDEVKRLHQPADVFAGNTETLAVEAAKDKEVLEGAGMDLTLISDLKPLAGALRYCQAEWMGEYKAKQEAQKQWATESVLGYKLQKKMLHYYSFAYRNLPNVLKKVKRIRDGSGHKDMIQDLLELGMLGQKYPDPLTAVKYPIEELEEAKAKSHTLSELLAVSNGDKDEYSETKALRDKAYTLLLQKTREVREYGRFVFWENPDRKEKYLND